MYLVDMAYNLVTREQWNARPPTRTIPLTWSKVDQFVVHYSGAPRSQSVRSIQNYCMDNKGHSDIDYNRLVRGKNCYVGRESNVGSHTLNQNSRSYGICIIGVDGDATDDDFVTVRTVYDELTAKLGRQLRKLGHRTAMPPGYTSCPGDEIQAWIDEGMPYPGGEPPVAAVDEGFNQSDRDRATADTHRLEALLLGKAEARYHVSWTPDERVEGNELKAQLDRIEALIAWIPVASSGITSEQLRQIIREEIAKTRLS